MSYICVENITKKYPNDRGNYNLNINIEKNEVYGIVGPNGAGKTTLIRQIMGFIKPDNGCILIDDKNPFIQREEILGNVGYVSGDVVLFEEMKAIKFLKLMAKLKTDVDWEFVEKLVRHFELDTRPKIKKMSKGMRQKMGIIIAVMNKPQFVVFDEPSSGLDPIMQERFEDLVLALKKEGTTFLICSHIFQEISKLCDRVGFIKDGNMVNEFKIGDEGIEEIAAEFKKSYETKGEF